MHKTFEGILRGLIIFASFYFLFEALLYLFNIRLLEVKALWPLPASTYAKYVGRVLGSMFLLLSIFTFEIQRDLRKYRRLIILSSIWALFDGLLLFYLSFAQDFVKIYQNTPSLYVWFPGYNQFVYSEGAMLVFYSVLVYLWARK